MAEISNESNESSNQDKDELKILDEAKARFKLAEEAEADNRRLALEDLEFAAGKQWDDRIRSDREQDGRPCLVINKIPQFIQQVTNDQRQNRPSIKVHPVDDNGDPETAKVLQELIRHIEYNSNAEVAFDTAFEFAVKGGFGYYRIVTEYASPISFEQEILIKRIPNPFMVYFDPSSQEPDGSDANFAFVSELLTEDEYKAKYPNSKLSNKDEWQSVGDQAPSWMPDQSARVVEYFYKEHREEKIYLLNTGETIKESELPEMLPEGIEIVKERTAQVPTICWVKMNACEILEKTEWPGAYIPIVPVLGSELNINGKRTLAGIIRHAKDSARMYNVWASAEAEAIALAPRAPFIAAEGQLEGYENEWANANRKNFSVLTYKPTDVKGNPVGPPQRHAFEPAVQAITQARMLASDDLKATTGIYDAALGAKSNETSGIAIQRRNVQAQTSNYHFIDNLTRSLRHTGRILIDLIPKIYDSARVVRIIGEDGSQRVVKVNDPNFIEPGKEKPYMLDVGKYDVTVDVGPSFQTKRQEAVASMLEMTRSVPQIMQIAGDLLVKNMDWPGATDIAERLKKTLPPNLVDDPESKTQPIPPQIQAQMQQMNQMVEQLTQKLHEQTDIVENKRLELESRERIEMKKLEVQLEIERAKLDAKDSLALLNAEIGSIEQRLNLLNQNVPIEHDQEFYSDPNGGMPADQEMGMQEPTGGFSPGLPMEGNEP